jgi:hypothetical protein
MTKFFYIVEHFVPFPQSEYGGLWNVIAEDEDECFDLIVQQDKEFNVQHYTQLRQNIQNARTYALSELNENLESKIVEEFTT